MKTLSDWTPRLIGWVCRCVLYVTLSVTFVILAANVGLRYVLGTGLAWASELPELLFPWMIMAGVVLAAQHGSHIAVVLLTDKLGAARRWVLAAGAVAVAALYLGLAWAAVPLFEISSDEFTPILQMPGSVTVGALMAGFVLLAVVSLLKVPGILTSARAAPDFDTDLVAVEPVRKGVSA